MGLSVCIESVDSHDSFESIGTQNLGGDTAIQGAKTDLNSPSMQSDGIRNLPLTALKDKTHQ